MDDRGERPSVAEDLILEEIGVSWSNMGATTDSCGEHARLRPIFSGR